MEHLLRPGIHRIIATLYRERRPLHLRELAKEAACSLQGTVRTVNELVKNGLLSEERLANLRRLNLNYRNTETQAILTSIDEEKTRKLPRLVQAALTEFCHGNDHQFILLFGSYAKGNQTKTSDLDVFVFVKKLPTTMADVEELNTRYGVRINPVFTDRLDSASQQHILATGIPLAGHARYYEERGDEALSDRTVYGDATAPTRT